ADEGDTIAVGELMCYIEVESADNTEQETTDKKDNEAEVEQNEKTDQTNKDQSMKKRYSPAVLRLAQENDLELEQIDGTGRGGRVTRKDVEKQIAAGGGKVQKTQQDTVRSEDPPPYQVGKSTSKPQGLQTDSGDIEIPVKGVRKAIADNMVKSTTEIPHAWMTVEVDVTELVEYRNAIKDEFKQKEGFSLTFFAFFVKSVAQSLKKYPQLN